MPTLEEEGVRAIGIAWMREEDYQALIRIFEDGHMFSSWEEWSEHAEATEKKFQNEGVIVLRAYLDPAIFPAWCAARNIAPAVKRGLNSASSLLKNDTAAIRVKVCSIVMRYHPTAKVPIDCAIEMRLGL